MIQSASPKYKPECFALIQHFRIYTDFGLFWLFLILDWFWTNIFKTHLNLYLQLQVQPLDNIAVLTFDTYLIIFSFIF